MSDEEGYFTSMGVRLVPLPDGMTITEAMKRLSAPARVIVVPQTCWVADCPNFKPPAASPKDT